jgi:hypothetical protein
LGENRELAASAITGDFKASGISAELSKFGRIKIIWISLGIAVTFQGWKTGFLTV